MCNGTRQSGVLSPYLFTRYIRDLLREVNNTGTGCFIGDQCINILAYADDLVLIAPSWRPLQILLNVVHMNSTLIDLSCNVSKTVCMTFTPKNRNRVITGRMPLSGKLPVLNLLTGQKSGFSPRRGDSLHRFKSNLAGQTDTWVRLAVQNFTSIAAGDGNAAPQNIKNFHFMVKSRPVGATPLTDFQNV